MPLETFLVVVYGHVCGALQAVFRAGTRASEGSRQNCRMLRP
ncbi:MAG: hypothetical protein AW06_001340 [Candidatus Accumulibacter cognatus]|uniref:Uncharacterized protein n=1 Tax=Candidatus Accumulibacter cognatus TaxID=2954383 RepID=A0A080M9D3_9PROT|nr:MAG: hypothetical protein AW06_001340 [Candidatus Accumulibacter cognatus]